ncbi:lipase 3-like isoform X2 [Musca autumnalis]
MMHGLMSSSDCWVIRGLKDALAFQLVERGYDVWLGNARGNTYGSRHSRMTTSDRQFWRFSWHEIASTDLPTMLDYVLAETQQSSLHYIGHSQGCTIVFVLLSTLPQYSEKFKSLNLLAPAAFMANVRAPIFRLLQPIFGRYSPVNELLGDTPLLQIPILHKLVGLDKCRMGQSNPEYCASLLYFMSGGYSAYFNHSLLVDVFSSHPSTASTHQAIHYLQLEASGKFRQYDFGREGNMLRYNNTLPPKYPLENINPRFPLHLYYSDYDELATRKDIEKLSKILGNRSVDHFVGLKDFSHIDFIWGNNIDEVINRPILQVIADTEEKVAENK